MAVDLAAEPGFAVTAADLRAEVLHRLEGNHGLCTLRADLSHSKTVQSLVQDYDLVVSAVPGFIGFRVLQAVLEAKKNIVDISFFAEDPFPLDSLARQNGVTAIVDCGVAPGMSNLLVGYAQSRLDELETVAIYVGGLPEVRVWPFEYKAVFSPADVIEEYVRPARLVRNGAVVVRPALSEPELLTFPELGTLEAFNTDGLRTLLQTINAPDMTEKTLRYPGHVEKMILLRETGFFNRDEIDVNGVCVRPIEVTAKLLFPKWKLAVGDRDLTVMKVTVEGGKAAGRWRYTYDLLDRYDAGTGTHSMARTTGYTATVVARLVAHGLIADKGIIAPEMIGRRPECARFVLDGLAARGVNYRETVTPL